MIQAFSIQSKQNLGKESRKLERCNSVHKDIPLIATGPNAPAEWTPSSVITFSGKTKVGQYLMLPTDFPNFPPPNRNDREIV